MNKLSSYQKLKQRIQELEHKQKELYSDIRSIALYPDSLRSHDIKAMAQFQEDKGQSYIQGCGSVTKEKIYRLTPTPSAKPPIDVTKSFMPQTKE